MNDCNHDDSRRIDSIDCPVAEDESLTISGILELRNYSAAGGVVVEGGGRLQQSINDGLSVLRRISANPRSNSFDVLNRFR